MTALGFSHCHILTPHFHLDTPLKIFGEKSISGPRLSGVFTFAQNIEFEVFLILADVRSRAMSQGIVLAKYGQTVRSTGTGLRYAYGCDSLRR